MALGAVHERVRFRGEPWPYYLLALNEGVVYLARHQPALYDRSAQRIGAREIPPGSAVRVRYKEVDGVRWMSAVQIVMLAEDQSPFDPVAELDDG